MFSDMTNVIAIKYFFFWEGVGGHMFDAIFGYVAVIAPVQGLYANTGIEPQGSGPEGKCQYYDI